MTMTTEHIRLTRERIIAAALEIIDAEGVDGLSMRRLGKQLGVDPMAMYYHVPNKAALFDGIVEQVWTTVQLPEHQPGERWHEVLQAVFAEFRRVLLQHPRAVVLVGSRPTTSPAMLTLVDSVLGRLTEAGLPAVDAMQLIDCLSGFTVGKVLGEVGESVGGPTDTVQRAMASITPQTHPHLLGAMAAGFAFAPAEEFERGVRALTLGWMREAH